MAKPKVKIIDGDYWVEIVINGKSWWQGHTINERLEDLFKEVGLDVEWEFVDNSYWDEDLGEDNETE